jgi:hypothetical protein
MEIYNDIGRSLKCSEIEYYIKEHDKEKELNQSYYDDSKIFLHWFYIYNTFDNIHLIDSKIKEQIRISCFKVDDNYFELYVVKTEKQELPYVIQISLEEYEISENLIHINDNSTQSIIKFEVTKGFIGMHKSYYFKVIGTFKSDENGQKVNISWLDSRHNLDKACQNVSHESLI